jgi:hypothetical protein
MKHLPNPKSSRLANLRVRPVHYPNWDNDDEPPTPQGGDVKELLRRLGSKPEQMLTKDALSQGSVTTKAQMPTKLSVLTS